MIRVQGVSKGFGATAALRRVSLDVPRGRLVALRGPSGSGKTTLLRIIAGLEQPDEGALELDGRPALLLPPGKRDIGFVFQNYALFEHMSVFENVAFGLRVRRPRLAEAALRGTVEAMLARLGLPGLGPRRPSQLSGGQRQRVALARALAVKPGMLLLDEPFSALDEATRQELWGWLKQLRREFDLTIVLVTHDHADVAALADATVLLEGGEIVAQWPPAGPDLSWASARGDDAQTGWPEAVQG